MPTQVVQQRRETMFSRALRRFMEAHDMNQADLAERIDVAESTLSRWMNGWGVRQTSVEMVAAKLEMSPIELLSWAADSAEWDAPAEARLVAEKYLRLPDEQRKVILNLIKTLNPLDAMNKSAAARERQLQTA